jgi:hypothetical protein
VLKNLNDVIRECRSNYDKLEHRGDIHIDSELAFILTKELSKLEPKSKFEIHAFSITLINDNGLRTDLPSSLLWYGATFWELDEALNEYQQTLRELKEFLRENDFSSKDINGYLHNLPSPDEDFSSNIGQATQKFLTQLSSQDMNFFKLLLTDRDWWFQPLHRSEQTNGKTLERGDVFQSSFNLAARVIVANSSRLQTIVKAFTDSVELRNYFSMLNHDPVPYLNAPIDSDLNERTSVSYETNNKVVFAKSGLNKIFYGAPGTGKSYSISQGRDEEYLIRTVFHPDTQYSDFVGCLKPMMQDGNVGYQFRPGPFTDALIKAINNPTHSYSLVIEEINRAAAAAVFGEIFQLLDRDEDGSSTYAIHVSDPDLLHYLNISTSGYFSDGTLKIPSNLSLLATMNSSDQAVMPMDTAFKRRWQFEYLRIDYNKASSGQLTFNVSSIDKPVPKTVRWSDFARVINERLASERIPEDRLLGHRFISENELIGDTSNVLKGKLFMYLWDDVLRHGQHRVIFRDVVNINDQAVELANFGQLIEAFEQGAAVFNDAIEQQLSEVSEASSVSEIADSNDGL